MFSWWLQRSKREVEVNKPFSELLCASDLLLSYQLKQVMWPSPGSMGKATKHVDSGRHEDLGPFVQPGYHGAVFRSVPFV